MNKKTISLIMLILTVIIGVTSLIVALLAINRDQWLIATVMFIVLIGQFINYLLWRRKLR